MRTHTYQYLSATPVPDSTPPEHRPNGDDTPFRAPWSWGAAHGHAVAPEREAPEATLAELERTRVERRRRA